MKENIYKLYNRLRNKLYHNQIVFRIYSFFMSDIPDKRNSRRLQECGYRDLETLFDALNGSDIVCFCDFGTLLGFIRDNGFIAYDTDIDLAVINNDSFSWRKLEMFLGKAEMTKIHCCKYHNNITEQTYMFKDGVKVDFFLYDMLPDNKMRTFVYYKNHDLIYNNSSERSVKALVYPAVQNAERFRIHDFDFYVPYDYENRLEAIYGASWKIPDPNYAPDRKENIMPDYGEKINFRYK